MNMAMYDDEYADPNECRTYEQPVVGHGGVQENTYDVPDTSWSEQPYMVPTPASSVKGIHSHSGSSIRSSMHQQRPLPPPGYGVRLQDSSENVHYDVASPSTATDVNSSARTGQPQLRLYDNYPAVASTCDDEDSAEEGVDTTDRVYETLPPIYDNLAVSPKANHLVQLGDGAGFGFDA